MNAGTLHHSLRKTLTSRIHAVVAVAGASVVVISMLLRLSIPWFYHQLLSWKDYYTVTSTVEPLIGDRINERFPDVADRYITRDTSMVGISVIDGVETISLRDVERRLIDVDPRKDPFVRSLGAYFAPGNRNLSLFYARADVPPWLIPIQLRRTGIVEHGIPFVVEWAIPLLLLRASAVCVVLLIFAYRGKRKERFPLLLGIGPLAVTAIEGGMWGTVTALALAIGWGTIAPRGELVARFVMNRSLRELGHRLGKRDFISLIGSVGVALVSVPFHRNPWLAIVVCVLTCLELIAILIFEYGRAGYLEGYREHRVFDPVVLLQSDAFRGKYRGTAVLLAICFAILPVLDWTATLYLRRDIPTPEAVAPEGSSWETYSALFGEARELPNVADYMAHTAYQRWLHTGRAYQFPVEGSEVLISTYHEVDGRIEKRSERLFAFDSVWFTSVIGGARESGIMGMVLAQKHPVRVVRSHIPPVRAILWYCAFLGVVCMMLLAIRIEGFETVVRQFSERFGLRRLFTNGRVT